MKEEEKGQRKDKVKEIWQGVHTEFLPCIRHCSSASYVLSSVLSDPFYIKLLPWKLGNFPRPHKPEVAGLQSCHTSVQFDYSGSELTKLHFFLSLFVCLFVCLERERLCVHEWGKSRERGRHRILVCAEPDLGL